MGRFINEDTYEGQIANPLSMNLYTYVENNPLSYVDPSGNYCVSKDGKYGHMGKCNDPTNQDNYVRDHFVYGHMPIVEKGVMVGYYDQSKYRPVTFSKAEQVTFNWNSKEYAEAYYELINATPPMRSPYPSGNMSAPGGFIKVTNPNGIQFLEKALQDGRGVRLNLDGTFKGFIDK